MDAIESKARDLLAYQCELGGYMETAAAYRDGMFDANPPMLAVIAALTMSKRFEAQACAEIDVAQIAQRRSDRAGHCVPDGYVMIQILDAERLCKNSKHSPTSALSARRVEACIKAQSTKPEIPND